jgi:carboxymethylenebutenolidase
MPDSEHSIDQEETVIEEEIEIRTADGTSDGFLYRAEAGRRWPGVIHLTDIGGIRPSPRNIARRLAAEGYSVLMPNVFYRTGRPPMFDSAASAGDERRMKRFAELASPLMPEAVERDASYYVDFLAADGSVGEGGMGVNGVIRQNIEIAAMCRCTLLSARNGHGK